ncbi:MAG: Ig-like domain-containing protein [Jatrophihabitans sp.]|uniref:Ig-like domain-containing protein n=1 Tax=Jatrophihabitans sp. TaxID=1932789 RepID=UPI003F7E99C4
MGTAPPSAAPPRGTRPGPPAASGGATSKLEIPVLGDWRDDENDPLTLQSASVPAGQGDVSPTSDGNLIYTAPAKGSSASISYVVADGYGKTSTATIKVTILAGDSLKGVPPTAQTDVAQGLVGQPITIEPLANDLPGADPTTDNPQLTLASVTKLPGTETQFDSTTGTVTFTGLTPRTYKVPYSISYGAQSAAGFIRIDVHPQTRAALGVVALPDTAVLHGNTASIVDVLANDYDQTGALMAVLSAKVETPNAPLAVSVTDSRYLRLVNTGDAVEANPVTVSYVVSDGTTTATGSVSVVEFPAGGPDQPVALPDSADVRVGDSVSIPVLQNDIDPAGGQLTIQPGSVTNPGGGASAFVTGSTIRFVAPPTGAAGTATFDYVATNGSESDTGTVTVRIHALPKTPADNLPPDPGDITASTTAGGRVVVHLPTSGVDPDGDSVTFAGVTKPAPTLGMVLATTANTLTYEAFPSAQTAGTDTIGYLVQDRFGAIGSGQIRIAVLSPGQAQPPVAVDDTAEGAPHARLAINVVANDLVPAGDAVTVTVLDGSHAQVDRANPHVIDVDAPADQQLTTVDYQISDGVSDPSAARLTVIGHSGWDNAPVAVDDQAVPKSPGDDFVDVPVLKNDYDPDRADTVKIDKVLAPSATVVGQDVHVTLTTAPQVVPYEITDGTKTAVAVIFVPAKGSGAPFVKPNTVIAVPQQGAVTFDINQYVVDPNGKQLKTTFVGTQFTAPGDAVTVKADGPSVTLTGAAKYNGPGALTLQVTDGVTPATKGAVTGWVTIPLQIGKAVPVLRCPTDDDRALYQGGTPEHLLLTHYCNVWTPQNVSESSVRFTAAWSPAIPGVDKSVDGQTLTLVPTRDAHAGESGAVAIGVVGSTQQQIVHYHVLKVALATVSPLTVNAREGKPVTVDVTKHVTTKIGDPQIKVLDCTQTAVGTAPATCAKSGSSVTITPKETARGTTTFGLQVTDVPGDPTRSVAGAITMTVIGKPAAVASVTAYPDRVKGGSVRLVWPSPAYNGGVPIDGFYVTYAGSPAGGRRCAASGCIIDGLKNGQQYTFTVRTKNLVGEYSLGTGTVSNPATPDTKPLAPATVTVAPAGDGKLMVSWSPATNNGSALTNYYLQISGPDRSGEPQPVGLGVSKLVTGLTNNDQYRFRVAAENKDGLGPFSVPPGTLGQSAGKPNPVSAPSVPAEQLTSPQPTVSVHVTWNALASQDYNGGPIKYYSVYRRKQGTVDWGAPLPNCAQVSPGVLACDDTVDNDGTTWEYAVTATNTTTPDGGGMESVQGPASSFKAVGLPDAPTNVEAFASQAAFNSGTPDPGPAGGTGAGFDQAIKVRFTVPKANGAALTAIEYSLNGGAFQTLQSSSLTPGDTATGTIAGLTNGTGYTVALRAKNEANEGPPSDATAAEYPYGAPTTPTATATNNGNTVTYSWGGGSNGRAVRSYLVNIDGGGFVDKGSQPGSFQADRGYAASYSLVVYVIDVAGQQSQQSPTASGRTPDVPPPPGLSCSGSGKNLNCSWSSAGNGLTYRYHFDNNGWTSTGGLSASATFDYNQTHSITVESTDGTHFSTDSVANGTTGSPPYAVIVSKGAQCAGNCTGCTASTCYKIHVQTQNFPGNVTCSFNSDHGSAGFIDQVYGPNDSHDADDWYGYPNTYVYVTCNGVQGSVKW